MKPLFASIENLIVVLVLLALSGISTWLNKRKQEKAEREAAEQRRARQAEAPPAEDEADLEEALRRLLGGETETKPVPPVVALPPVLQERRAPTPMPVDDAEEGWGELKPTTPAPRFIPELAPAPVTLAPTPPAEPVFLPVAPLLRTARRHSARAAELTRWLRDPQQVRTAFVAAQVFGPPKALE